MEIKSYKNLSTRINKLFKNNHNVKDQAERSAITKKHSDLLHDLSNAIINIEQATKPTDYQRVKYYHLITELGTWISKGSGDKNKNYNNRNHNETASEIKDTVDNSNRIYTGDKNYYTGGRIEPTKSELKNKYIKQANDDLKEARTLKGNGFKRSKAINAAKNNLNESIKSHRGINHVGRVDNTVTPETMPTDIPLSNRDYAKYVLTHSKKELPVNENIRLDKIAVNQTINTNDPILKDAEIYNQRQTAERNNVAVSTVNYKLNKAIDKIVTIK